MSIEMRTERKLEGPFTHGVYPVMVCDVCERPINTMNPGVVLGMVKEATAAYHVHNGKCLSEYLNVSTEFGWVVEEIHDHFFRLLSNMGFFVEDGQIVLERPV